MCGLLIAQAPGLEIKIKNASHNVLATRVSNCSSKTLFIKTEPDFGSASFETLVID
jgi:hypothetical protein